MTRKQARGMIMGLAAVNLILWSMILAPVFTACSRPPAEPLAAPGLMAPGVAPGPSPSPAPVPR